MKKRDLNREENRMEKEKLATVYVQAQKYAPSVMQRYGLPSNKFSPEDVVGEFMVNFIEKGFDKKFDENESSLNRYVFLGVRNTAISMVRKVKYEVQSLDAMPEWKEVGQFPIDEFILEDIMALVDDLGFGYGAKFEFDGEILDSDASSVLKLIYKGFNRKEIAKAFGVTQSTISNVMDKVREVLKRIDVTEGC